MSATSRKFDFLWTSRQSLVLRPGLSDEFVLERIEALLRSHRKDIDERGTDFVAFKGSSPLEWRRGPAFNFYDLGVFWIERKVGERVLHWRLRCLHVFVFFALFASAVFMLVAVSGHIAEGAIFGAVLMLWVYGLNRPITSERVVALIERTVEPERR